ncbi:cell division protein FtsZ [Halorubrum sp. Atlit-8R]|uniref:cell division protein FtsZ n=1 Tax=unclassified Halorubrum TaxID=2642239 RepID=UPI000EF19E3F|nr:MULTISPECIES: cell division protein FtsZ [unclassified Halorubrum]RLM71589.1 cell division protein FtsZ [Halorubrum sp. Atlit-9R]RLM82257.1 cell division protein FtsZ [Halorubrum sp. Atlit-8R]
MKLALVGVGGCGTRLVDRFVRTERHTGRSVTNENVLAFHTESQPFRQTTAVSTDQQVLLGDTHPAVLRRDTSTTTARREQTTCSRDTPSTHSDTVESESHQGTPSDTSERSDGTQSVPNEYGVGGDPDVGAQVAMADRPEIRRALDRIDETEVAATLLVAGLGGGTGSGVGSVLLDELTAIHETPVYALGVLPAATEPAQRALTAARGLQTLVPRADSVFLVDNEAWCQNEDTVMDCYSSTNTMTVERLLSVFGVGERATTSSSELRVDPADITRTLDLGGVTTVGRATTPIDAETSGVLTRVLRLLRRSSSAAATPVDASQIKTLIGQALQSKLTLPCEITSADRVLLILTGPPDTISRKGFETGRYLLEEETETVEVLAGDEPVHHSTELTATVVLSNVTSVPRIDQLQHRAVAAQPGSDTNEATAAPPQAERADTSSGTDHRSAQSRSDTDTARNAFDFGDVEVNANTVDSPEE